MSWSRRIAVIGTVLSVMLGSCTNDALTEIVVVIDSDLAVPSALDEISIQVEGASGIPKSARVTLTGAGSALLPVTLGLRPSSPGSSPVTIRATGLLVGTRKVFAEVRTSFIEGRRLVVRIVLSSACLGVVCASGETCSPAGACVPADVDPITLPPYIEVPFVRDAGVDAPTSLAVGATCVSDSVCESRHCECIDFDCLVRACAPAECLCGYGTSGSCGDPLRAGTVDPEDCEGPASSCQGLDSCLLVP
jgi:hypothetical protein